MNIIIIIKFIMGTASILKRSFPWLKYDDLYTLALVSSLVRDGLRKRLWSGMDKKEGGANKGVCFSRLACMATFLMAPA